MAYSTITKPADYFNTALWTATGTQSITGVGFQPDLVWVKPRSTIGSHHIMDSVRGASKYIQSDTADEEATVATFLTSFDSDGFSFGSGNWSDSRTVVGWNWLGANASSSNTDGSITSSVSANTTSGFSIVSYTGTGSNATVGHGLGVAPSMVIIKNRTTAAQNWQCYHSALGGTKGIQLNTTGASFTDSTRFNDTDPTSSVFSIGTATDVNTSSASMIAYCFAEKKGFSKFGSYTGNGSTDGTFVYTGFKPAFLLIKRDAVESWILVDNKRDTYNYVRNYLLADTTAAETSGVQYDFLSNGFKFRASSQNESGATYIYMAFAENPLVTSSGIPATAR